VNDFTMNLSYAVNMLYMDDDIIRRFPRNLPQEHDFNHQTFFITLTGIGIKTDTWDNGHFFLRDGEPRISGNLFALSSELSHAYEQVVYSSYTDRLGILGPAVRAISEKGCTPLGTF